MSRGGGVRAGAGVRRRFVVGPWSPLCHSVYPRSFRDAVVTVLMANGREDALPSALPPALWMEVCACVLVCLSVCRCTVFCCDLRQLWVLVSSGLRSQ